MSTGGNNGGNSGSNFNENKGGSNGPVNEYPVLPLHHDRHGPDLPYWILCLFCGMRHPYHTPCLTMDDACRKIISQQRQITSLQQHNAQMLAELQQTYAQMQQWHAIAGAQGYGPYPPPLTPSPWNPSLPAFLPWQQQQQQVAIPVDERGILTAELLGAQELENHLEKDWERYARTRAWTEMVAEEADKGGQDVR